MLVDVMHTLSSILEKPVIAILIVLVAEYHRIFFAVYRYGNRGLSGQRRDLRIVVPDIF